MFVTRVIALRWGGGGGGVGGGWGVGGVDVATVRIVDGRVYVNDVPLHDYYVPSIFAGHDDGARR